MKKTAIILSLVFFIIFLGLFLLVSRFLPEAIPILDKFPAKDAPAAL